MVYLLIQSQLHIQQSSCRSKWASKVATMCKLSWNWCCSIIYVLIKNIVNMPCIISGWLALCNPNHLEFWTLWLLWQLCGFPTCSRHNITISPKIVLNNNFTLHKMHKSATGLGKILILSPFEFRVSNCLDRHFWKSSCNLCSYMWLM